MGQVISPDGTPIAYQRSGNGPPLLLVHGSIADRRIWTPVLPALEQRFTVYAMDRRGRGKSADTGRYAFEREFEDVAALVDALGPEANVVAHSFGAICALEAALLTSGIRRLVLYEPPILLNPTDAPQGVLSRIDALLAGGDRDGALAHFYREVMGMSPEEIDKLRARPVWKNLVAVAHTLSRELNAVRGYAFSAERFSAVTTPVLLVAGSQTRRHLRAVVDALGEVLPHSRVIILEGQGHSAMSTAPKLFADTVLDFLLRK